MLKGHRHSEETKREISEAKKGKRFSSETEFKKGNKVNSGRKHSAEHKRKTSKTWFKKGNLPWNKGKELSEKTKRKIGEALKGHLAWNRGKATPEETKKKLSKLLKGKHRSPKTEFKKGQFTGDKNPSKRLEVREKISKVKRGKLHLNQRGENHPGWKGGVTSENEKRRKSLEYKLWRELIFVRDNWTCQRCRERGGKLNIHHLYNFADFPGLQTSVENGITLCKECHKEFHKIYGLKNNTEEKIKEFLDILNYNKGG